MLITRAVFHTREQQWERRAFLFIILAAAATRLWRLEIPSLWFDEILVAMVAKLPCLTILKRSLAEDFHPPGFYLLAKLAMSMGRSDTALRLPQVAFGLAGVWFAWKVGRELLSEGAGVALAALTAVQPWHVLLSRQLRPYSIIFLFCFMSFYYVARAIRHGRDRDFILAGLTLWPPLLLHFSSLLAAGGAGLILLAAFITGRVKGRGFVLFCIPCAVGLACALPFVASLLGREKGITGTETCGGVVLVMRDRLAELLSRELYPVLRLGLGLMSAAGLVILFFRDRLLAWVGLGWILPPLCVLVAVRYGSYFNPWHLMFLLPPLLLAQTQVLRSVLGERGVAWAGVLLVAWGCWWYPVAQREHYFEPGSYSGAYAQEARDILGACRPDMAYVYPMNGQIGPINWYLDRFSNPNPVRHAVIRPQDEAIQVTVPGVPGKDLTISRAPVQRLGPPPYRTRITGAPEDFLSKVHDMEYMTCQPVLEDILVATQVGRTGHADFVFENGSDEPQRITVHFGFSNKKAGNRFAVKARFDDEPWAAVFESLGPDTRAHEMLELHRNKPFQMLTVRFELSRNGRSATFTGDDMDAVRMLDFKIETDFEKK